MEKRIERISDYILLGYVLQGVTTLLDWSVAFMWISLALGLIALFLSVRCIFFAKQEENKNKKLRKSIYYIVLSSILIVICAYRAVN